MASLGSFTRFRSNLRLALALSLLAAGCLTTDVEQGCQGDCDSSRAACTDSCGDDRPCRDVCNMNHNLCLDECSDD